MKKKSNYLLIILIVLLNYSCYNNKENKLKNNKDSLLINNNNDKWIKMDVDKANFYLNNFLKDSLYNSCRNIKLIKDESMAISLVEPIIFRIYGEKEIINERPYKICLTKDYWVITGDLNNKFSKGGVFEVVINSKNGNIIGITHGK